MQRGVRQYQNPGFTAVSPREGEIIAFSFCNTKLTEAAGPVQRIEALHKNHRLWSLLVKDLGLEGNGLPAALKQQLIGLGLWVMEYSIAAMTRDVSLDPLIAVNRDMIEALQSQAGGASGAPAEGAGAPSPARA